MGSDAVCADSLHLQVKHTGLCHYLPVSAAVDLHSYMLCPAIADTPSPPPPITCTAASVGFFLVLVWIYIQASGAQCRLQRRRAHNAGVHVMHAACSCLPALFGQ